MSLSIDICFCFIDLFFKNKYTYSETVCISSKIKELTGWHSNYHTLEDIIIFFKERYPTKDGRLILYGLSGEYLRTLSPKDYFRVVEYEKKMSIFI